MSALKIFTTYHAISRDDDINISLYQPKFRKAKQSAKLFVPTYQLFKINDMEELRRCWFERLNQLFPTEKSLENYVIDLQGDKNELVLCCYEKDRTQCHRSIIGDFIEEKLGIEVREKRLILKKENKLLF